MPAVDSSSGLEVVRCGGFRVKRKGGPLEPCRTILLDLDYSRPARLRVVCSRCNTAIVIDLADVRGSLYPREAILTT